MYKDYKDFYANLKSNINNIDLKSFNFDYKGFIISALGTYLFIAFDISCIKFQARISKKSGLRVFKDDDGNTGICKPGVYSPCFKGLSSTIKSKTSTYRPNSNITVVAFAGAPNPAIDFC